MLVVREGKNVAGIPLPNETRLIISGRLPDTERITCAFVLAFQQDQLLLTHLHERGWDIPGGHIEPGETPEEAVKRELYEETGASIGSPMLLGYEQIRLLGEKPAHYKYPYPDSYMVFYTAAVARLDAFGSTDETAGRSLFEPERAYRVPWVKEHSALYEEALRRASLSG
ncbi:NUDIX domain-containing protein [Paenibacillus allorhizosphaerae]|uniref:RNA pyrophosphohydrolase n=1 Tax=Paenibacillus allorhizosphaerae TaxID=2849866 RepID=A0ABM8VKK3_9BACL|nr:NUDIX domain-containing protein [Paenibacillus allorhizosphaerae]CAG7646563.1 RNA pyrophosphohydrolase [Paenibacillus allorhizosphaerae]